MPPTSIRPGRKGCPRELTSGFPNGKGELIGAQRDTIDVPPEGLAFARIIVMNTPHLDRALCRGHWELFDRHAHKDPNRERDGATALRCRRCGQCSARSSTPFFHH